MGTRARRYHDRPRSTHQPPPVVVGIALAIVALLAAGSMRLTVAHAVQMGQRATCSDYPTQLAAQAAYRADPARLADLDRDRDGIVCESNPCPCDFVPVAAVRAPSTPPAQTEATPLAAGCNNVASTWPAGTPMATVAAAVDPPTAVTGIWRFDAAAGRFAGFSPAVPQASDLRSVAQLAAVFICVDQPASLRRPLLAAAP